MHIRRIFFILSVASLVLKWILNDGNFSRTEIFKLQNLMLKFQRIQRTLFTLTFWIYGRYANLPELLSGIQFTSSVERGASANTELTNRQVTWQIFSVNNLSSVFMFICCFQELTDQICHRWDQIGHFKWLKRSAIPEETQNIARNVCCSCKCSRNDDLELLVSSCEHPYCAFCFKFLKETGSPCPVCNNTI